MIIDREDIKKLLPHRTPFLSLDSCDIKKVGSEGVGYRKFLGNEYFFEGHFPDKPIVPGVILVEALAQTAGVVVAKGFENTGRKSVLFMSISNAKFRKPVLPNDEISFEVNMLNKVKSVYKFNGIALNNATKVCEAAFSAMIVDKPSSEIF